MEICAICGKAIDPGEDFTIKPNMDRVHHDCDERPQPASLSSEDD